MDKMREEFEAWAMSDMGYMCVRVGGGYKDDYMNTAWLAWKASRSSLCVELPDSKNDYQSSSYYEDGWLKGFNHCLDEVSSILDSDGVQYK